MPPDIMTPRDYFAAAALTGLLAARAGDGIPRADLAKMAVHYADALVAATLQPAKPSQTRAAAAGVLGHVRAP